MVSRSPCTADGCNVILCDPHHVTTVKAGGGDTMDNVMSLCRAHHTEWHKSGPGHMVAKYPKIRKWLVNMGRNDILERIERGKNEGPRV